MSTSVVDLGAKLDSIQFGVKDFIEKHNRGSQETSARLKETASRLLAIEQRLVSDGVPFSAGGFDKSIGAQIVESDGFQALQKGANSSGRIPLKRLLPDTKAIVSGTWTAPPDYRPVMITPPVPLLPVRALMPSMLTVSNMVEYPVEQTFTNNADYQITEGTNKPESTATYQIVQLPIATVAHFLTASKQLVDDSLAFTSYIDSRLLHFLEAKVEHELLFGSGAPRMQGICTVARAATSSPGLTLADSVGAAIGQLAGIGAVADAVVLNPVDWATARMSKASTSGVYLLGNPADAMRPSLWGLNVALAVSMPQGRFLVGAFRTGAAIFDREMATIAVSREHASYFVQNLIAILVELRMTVAVFQPMAFIYGSTGGGAVVGS